MNRIINKPIIPMCDQLNNNKNNQISISQRELLQKQRNGTNSTSRQTMKKKLSLGLLTSSCYCIFIMFLLSVSIVTSFTINNVNSVRSNTRYLSSPVTTQNNNNQNLIILQMMNDDDKKKKSNSKGGGFGGTGSTAAAGSSTTTKTTTTTSTSKRGVRQPKSTGSNFVYSGTTRPGKISTQKVVVDSNIIKPDYYNTGIPIKTGKMMFPWMIEVKTSEEINKMKQSGILARHILDYAGTLVNQPGITTDDIDHAVHNEIIKVSIHFLICGCVCPYILLVRKKKNIFVLQKVNVKRGKKIFEKKGIENKIYIIVFKFVDGRSFFSFIREIGKYKKSLS